MPASSRSTTSTSAPSFARKYAVHNPARPPPITSTSACRVSAGSAGSGCRCAGGFGAGSSGASNSGASNISGAAGTGRSGARGAAKAKSSGAAGQKPRMVAEQKRPWQRPMPARVAFFSAASEVSPPASSARNRPAVTSSQRQTMVSSGSEAGRSRIGRNSRHSASWNADARASAPRVAGSSGAGRPRSRAAASPASRPRAIATRDPPSDAPSPTANTPATEVRPSSSVSVARWPRPTSTKRCGAPSARASPTSGWKPRFSATTSTS